MKHLLPVTTSAALVLALGGNAQAQSAYDYYAPTPFEGVYAGGYVGTMFDSDGAATFGAMAGVNFELTELLLAGAEVQGGVTAGPDVDFDALMLGKGGVLLTEEAMLYGAAGGGLYDGASAWALGGGGEISLTDSLGVRGEVLAIGPWGDGWETTKATVGAVWHLD